MPISLEPILPHVPAWLLVLFRLAGIFLFAPMFASVAVPARVKVMLALALSACVYPALIAPGSPAQPMIAPVIAGGLSLPQLAGVVVAEMGIGLVIGFGASLPLIAMQVGGRMIDQQIGLGLAGIFNPDFDEQTGVVGEFFYIMALAVFLILGGHRLLLGTLIGSFSHVPLGGFAADVRVVQLVLGMATVMFELAIRVAAPLLCLVFLESVALGFVARTVPQLNILSVGFPVRILLGVGLTVTAIGVINGAFVSGMRRTLEQIGMIFGF